MAAPRPSLPPRYAVQDLVAHGGMGDVYRAADERLGRTVAIKVLAERYARQDEFRKRFLREARTAATLTGEPNVVAIYDVGETTDGLPFIVMEYVPDGTVADRLSSGPVPPDLAMRWLAQAAGALDAAHARGIVHRDVKPANLLVSSDGNLYVSDFGIARAAGDDTLTAAGTVLGSTGYMAPEQARGESSTPATDRYALACVAFELLTGRRPFARDAVAAEAAAHAYEPPPPIGNPAALPAALDEVFARGLAKRPSVRPPTCAALVADLREALAGGGTRTIPVALPTRTAEQPRIVRHRSGRSRAALLGGATALLAAGVGLAWALTSLGGDSGTATVVVTETSQGRTVERTVTESDTVVVTETAEDTPEGDTGSVPAGESGEELNDRGFRLLQQGDPEGAVPVLESAVSRLQGSSSLAEAYASYNLAVARFTVGRCDGVAELLDRSEQVQGKRKEIDRLRKEVERRCRAEDED
jgi:serine/threonine-protein kinase